MENLQFGLIEDMFQAPDIIKNFDISLVKSIAETASEYKKIYFSGEGSSRLFPAGRTVFESQRSGARVWRELGARELEHIISERGEKTSDTFFILLSNSGKTAETVDLAEKLNRLGQKNWAAVTACSGSVLENLAPMSLTLQCGKEHAVAATKSVIEQALICHGVFSLVENIAFPDIKTLSELFLNQLSKPVPTSISSVLASSGTIYFAGPSDGCINELALKSAEILRKRAVALPGTFCLHGIEEVMENDDQLILCGSFIKEEEKIERYIHKAAKTDVISISGRETLFAGLKIADTASSFQPYLILAAGWNLLASAGLLIGHDLDNPSRARKIGNELN